MDPSSKRFLIVAALIAPLLLALLGGWQHYRASDWRSSLKEQAQALDATVAYLEAQPAPANGGINPDVVFRHGGQAYVGDLAIAKAREARRDLAFPLTVANLRQKLPPIIIGASLAVLAIGIAVMVTAAVLAGVGARSRPALVRSFSWVRRLLPLTLVLHVVLAAVAVVCAVLFEAAVLLRFDNVSQGQVYAIGLAVVVMGLAVVTAFQAIAQLRRLSSLFEPDEQQIIAEPVSRSEAPGLWKLTEGFARRLGASVPDNIIVGLPQGFFVTSGAVSLVPGGQKLTGNTLHVPLAHLALLATDETATIIGHELAHFVGEDTLYTQKFLPIYAGLSRSLDALAAAGRAKDGSLSFIASPAIALGYFVAERFHHAVQQWSRKREFEADARSAELTSPDAGGRTLLRHCAINEPIDAVVAFAWEHPDRVPGSILPVLLDRAGEGLDDPRRHLEGALTHPTDSHPPNSQRLEAFHFTLDTERVAAAMAVPQSFDGLGQYFRDPDAIALRVSDGFVGVSRNSSAQQREALSQMASAVDGEAVALYENTRPIAIIMFVLAIPALLGAAWLFYLATSGGRMYGAFAILFMACGVFTAVIGFSTLRRGQKPFLRLFPDRVEHPNLDRPIQWADVMGMSVDNHVGTMVASFQFRRIDDMPKRKGGARGRVIIKPAMRVITLRSVPPRQYKSSGYIELLHRYADAASARRLLETAPAAKIASGP